MLRYVYVTAENANAQIPYIKECKRLAKCEQTSIFTICSSSVSPSSKCKIKENSIQYKRHSARDDGFAYVRVVGLNVRAESLPNLRPDSLVSN